jgi:hypothetical protein
MIADNPNAVRTELVEEYRRKLHHERKIAWLLLNLSVRPVAPKGEWGFLGGHQDLRRSCFAWRRYSMSCASLTLGFLIFFSLMRSSMEGTLK